jgi:hypothetical protein
MIFPALVAPLQHFQAAQSQRCTAGHCFLALQLQQQGQEAMACVISLQRWRGPTATVLNTSGTGSGAALEHLEQLLDRLSR